jgi:hypothetical protein
MIRHAGAVLRNDQDLQFFLGKRSPNLGIVTSQVVQERDEAKEAKVCVCT